tara:strand:+ start:60072 stop:60602 length:531 start_codon:yes stop_codon:yes gene_type:complete
MDKLSIEERLDEFYQERNFSFYTNFFLSHPKELEELLSISLQADKGKHCVLGTWVCAHLAEADKKPFQKIQKDILHFLQTETHQSSLRNWMKVMTFLPTPEEIEGEVIDLCISFIQNPENKVALQMYSILLLMPILKKYPELIPEIKAIIDLNSEGKSAAYHAISRKFEKFIKKIR